MNFFFFLHLPLGMGNTRGKCKAKYYQQVFKCMQLNNVLSVVTGTFWGGGGVIGFGLGGNHGGGGVTGREMTIFSDTVIP